MDFRILLVITPIIFSWIFTVFWLGRWDVFRLTPLGLPKKGVAPFKNYQVWEDSALIPDAGRPAEGYPVFTVRTAAVNALGIPTVFFLGAILAMQFKAYSFINSNGYKIFNCWISIFNYIFLYLILAKKMGCF